MDDAKIASIRDHGGMVVGTSGATCFTLGTVR